MNAIEKFTESILNLEAGSHVAYFYQNAQERRDVLSPVVAEGLRRNYGCIFTSWSKSRNRLELAVREEVGAAYFEKLYKSGQIVLLTEEAYFAPCGTISFEGGRRNCKLAVERLSERGCPKTFIIGDMKWVKCTTTGASNLGKLFDCQAEINIELFNLPAVAICCYQLSHFSKPELLDALCTHPLVLHNYFISENQSYVSPLIFLGREREGRGLEAAS